MRILIDTSVLVAAMVASEPHHDASAKLLDRDDVHFYAHGISETFSTLTGGRRAFRLPASLVSDMLENDFLPEMSPVSLAPGEITRALGQAETRGVRGGAVFDYLHLVAARKANASRLYTLNLSHFLAVAREDDPEITRPA